MSFSTSMVAAKVALVKCSEYAVVTTKIDETI